MQNVEKVMLQVKVDKPMCTFVDQLAEEFDRSRSWMLRDLLLAGLWSKATQLIADPDTTKKQKDLMGEIIDYTEFFDRFSE